MKLIIGNTYPVKDQIKAMGGKWDPAAKGWRVPMDRAEEAAALVGGKTSTTSTTAQRSYSHCRDCGAEHRYHGRPQRSRYAVCYDCKSLMDEDMGIYR